MTVSTQKNQNPSDAQFEEAVRDIRDTFRVLNMPDTDRAAILLALGLQELRDMGFSNVPEDIRQLFKRAGISAK
jgi:hypothetical protein